MRTLRNPFTVCALLLAIGLLGVLFTGCASMDDREKRCSTYADVYTLYLASTEVRPVSKEESAAAAAAAIFLRTYCGWTGPKAGSGTEEVDANGVPVIFPPTSTSE